MFKIETVTDRHPLMACFPGQPG